MWTRVGYATGWTPQGSNPGGGEVFQTHPDQPCGPPSLMYSGYQVSVPVVKWLGHGDHPPPPSAEVELYPPLPRDTMACS